MDIRELAAEEWQATEWGARLSEIPEPPGVLWARGAMIPAGNKALAVVGSRAMSRYGEEACQVLLAGLAGYPVSIISGLALGIDTAAHKAALAAGLHTLAFPGSGLRDDVLYPRSNRAFAAQLLEKGGGMLAEYPPDEPSRVHYFPERNRLMVGAADAVLIVEAGPKSGTLITARLAADYNRDLLAIPHRLGDPHGFGPHLFIRLGAALVSEPLHILEALKIPPKESGAAQSAAPDLAGPELLVWEILAEPLPRDELLRAASSGGTGPGPSRGLGAGDIMTALIALELRGLVKEEFGCWRRAQ